MGRFTHNGEKLTGTHSEEFHEAMRNAGPVECKVCQARFGETGKVKALSVCSECIDYFCDNHFYRHPNCSQGR